MDEHDEGVGSGVPATREVALSGADPDMSALAQQLVASANGRGIALTGEGGLLTALTRQVLQSALEAELADHLGYDKHDPMGRNLGNSRNGTTRKTVRTDIGELTIDVPRDRAGTFEPVVVPKHERRLPGFDANVISCGKCSPTQGGFVAYVRSSGAYGAGG